MQTPFSCSVSTMPSFVISSSFARKSVTHEFPMRYCSGVYIPSIDLDHKSIHDILEYSIHLFLIKLMNLYIVKHSYEY